MKRLRVKMVWGICQDMARKVSLSLSTGEQKRTTFLVTEDGPKVRLDTGPAKAEVISLCTEDGAQPLKVSPALWYAPKMFCPKNFG